MSKISNLTQRIRTLSLDLLNCADEDERDAIQQEIDDLNEEIETATEGGHVRGEWQ